MTKKYRCRINTPWCKKDAEFTTDYSCSNIDQKFCSFFDPKNYPDLFEPMEEMSNEEKWAIVFERFLLIPPKRAGFFLDHLGYNADKIYEYIMEGKK